MICLVTFEIEDDGMVVAKCPSLPGCVSQGPDQRTAKVNIKEAITAWVFAENQKVMHQIASTRTTSLHYVIV